MSKALLRSTLLKSGAEAQTNSIPQVVKPTRPPTVNSNNLARVLDSANTKYKQPTGALNERLMSTAQRIVDYESGNKNIKQIPRGRGFSPATDASGYVQGQPNWLSTARNRLRSLVPTAQLPDNQMTMDYSKDDQYALILSNLIQHPDARLLQDTTWDTWRKGHHGTNGVEKAHYDRWVEQSKARGIKDYPDTFTP